MINRHAIYEIFKNTAEKRKRIFRSREKIEHYFEKLGHTVYNNHKKALFILFLMIGALMTQAPKTLIDTSSESLLHEDDQIIINYNAFKEQFGRSGILVLAIQSKNIFDPSFLKKLESLHNDIEKETPFLKQVQSLINAEKLKIDGTALLREPFLSKWSDEDFDPLLFKKKVTDNPIYMDNIISKDGNLTAVIIETNTNIIEEEKGQGLKAHFEGDKESGRQRRLSIDEINQIVVTVKNVINRYQSSDFSIALSGGIVISDVYNQITRRDLKLCMALGLVVIAIFLAILFRRVSGIVLPMIVINSCQFSIMGLMGLFNIPIKIPTTVLPAFLLAVAVGDSVHILSIFYQSFNRGMSKEDAISHALGHSGLAVVMTSVTTAASLLSFSFAELSAIAEIGVLASVGVMLALLFTLIMLPALIAVIPLKPQNGEDRKLSVMDNLLLFIARISTSNPKTIVFLCLFMFIVSSFFMLNLRFSHNQINWFNDSMLEKKDLKLIDREFGGTISLEIIVDTKKKNGIFNYEILSGIEKFTEKVKTIKIDQLPIGSVFSINSFIKELNKAFHGDDPAYYNIPPEIEKIPIDLFLTVNEVPEYVENMADSQFSKTRITVNTPWVDAVIFQDFIVKVKELTQGIFNEKVDVVYTGVMALVARAIPAALHSMAKSYIIAFFVIAVMMIIVVGDIKIGLLSMIPNLLPIFIIMGLMGGIGIPLDMATIMIGSIAIGLVVDDTVHFLYNFQKYYNSTKDAYEAVRYTMLGTGRALLITSLVLSFGFFILMLSSLNNMIRFGLFTGLTIIFALLADFFLAPALMILVAGKNRKEGNGEFKSSGKGDFLKSKPEN